MEKRAAQRIPFEIEVKIFCGKVFYSGRVLNISESGMLIKTEFCSPVNSAVEVIFRKHDERIYSIFGKVCRIDSIDDCYEGVGVAVIAADRDYLELLKTLRVNPPAHDRIIHYPRERIRQNLQDHMGD
ncbi:MAG: PilZ domain-containing protein [Nitrospiraceae bacterium]|nr:MAG: PilZ domain-containing protein [Nitrospiraceae bacterium]